MRIRSSSSDRKKLRRARVALAARAAAQLVVDAAALVALGADHEQAAGGLHAPRRTASTSALCFASAAS